MNKRPLYFTINAIMREELVAVICILVIAFSKSLGVPSSFKSNIIWFLVVIPFIQAARLKFIAKINDKWIEQTEAILKKVWLALLVVAAILLVMST